MLHYRILCLVNYWNIMYTLHHMCDLPFLSTKYVNWAISRTNGLLCIRSSTTNHTELLITSFVRYVSLLQKKWLNIKGQTFFINTNLYYNLHTTSKICMICSPQYYDIHLLRSMNKSPEKCTLTSWVADWRNDTDRNGWRSFEPINISP